MKTKIANESNWHKQKKEKKPKQKSRLDVKFEEWAKRNGLVLRDIPVLEKK